MRLRPVASNGWKTIFICERCEVRVEIAGLSAQRDAPRIVAVEVGALPVLGGERRRFEVSGRGERPRIQRGVVGQLGNGDLRQHLANQAALDRVVVDEHHRVEPERELLRDRGDVRRLVVPVRLEDGDVVLPQQHVGVLEECAARDG